MPVDRSGPPGTSNKRQPTHEWGTMVCDAVARFAVDIPNPQEPVWINYTGGDSVWSVVVTPAAVYAQGHFRYLNNTFGNNTDGPADTAVLRKGVGAMDPETGLALAWDPAAGAKIGGKAFLATPAGVWFGADSRYFAEEYHRGLAFCPITVP